MIRDWLYSLKTHKHTGTDGSSPTSYTSLTDIPAGYSGTVTIAATDKTHTLVFVNGILTSYSAA